MVKKRQKPAVFLRLFELETKVSFKLKALPRALFGAYYLLYFRENALGPVKRKGVRWLRAIFKANTPYFKDPLKVRTAHPAFHFLLNKKISKKNKATEKLRHKLRLRTVASFQTWRD